MQERDDREAAAKHERAGLDEEREQVQQDVARPRRRGRQDERHESSDRGSATETRPSAHDDDERARRDEELRELGLRPDRGDEERDEDAPQERIAFVGAPRQAIRRDRDDRDHDGADPVEEGLHRGKAAVGDVQPGDGDDHRERRKDERETHERRSGYAVLEIPDRDRRLRRERARHDLRKGEREVVRLLGDDLALLDEILPHIADERGGAAETDRSKPQEVRRQLAQRGSAVGWKAH